jgi:hypothetical protein
MVLSSGGTVNEAAHAVRSGEEMTEAGRARVQRLRPMGPPGEGRALRRVPRPRFLWVL